jgi:hypothetical protein
VAVHEEARWLDVDLFADIFTDFYQVLAAGAHWHDSASWGRSTRGRSVGSGWRPARMRFRLPTSPSP